MKPAVAYLATVIYPLFLSSNSFRDLREGFEKKTKSYGPVRKRGGGQPPVRY